MFRNCEPDDKQDSKADSSVDGGMVDSDGIRNTDEEKDSEANKKNPKKSKPREPDTSRLKYLLLALIENGQRHDYHEHGPPRFGVHACARKGKKSDGKEYIYCRYLFPRELRSFRGEVKGCILEDPHRPDLRNLFLNRNDCLINSRIKLV